LAWAFVPLGLAESKQPGAQEAADRAIQEIDHLRESGPGPDQVFMLNDTLLNASSRELLFKREAQKALRTRRFSRCVSKLGRQAEKASPTNDNRE
jgi:hypothetical protein